MKNKITIVTLLSVAALAMGCHKGQTASQPLDKVQSPPSSPRQSEQPQAAGTVKPQAEDQTVSYEVLEIARQGVKSHLVSPRSAVFSGFAESKIGTYGYNQWMVSGFVDGQNSYGAALRDAWFVVVVKAGDSWDAVCGEVGDYSWGEIPTPAAWPMKPLTPEQIAAAKASIALQKQEAQAAALKYNQDLSDKGDAYGQLRMGQRYASGDGVPKDLVKARELLSKSAAQGNPEATPELATLPAR